MAKLKMDVVCQVAVVVNNLEEGLEAFRELFGIDESSLSYSDSRDAYAEGRLKEVKYNGVEGTFHYVQHNFYMGGMDIEMFAPIPGYEDEVNPFTDFLKENGGPGIHHLNIRLVNREEGVEYLEKDLGVVPMYDLYHLGRNCKYYDFRKELGLVIEYGMRLVGPRASMSEEELARLSAYR
ncbi:MAG: hypothetical protein ACI4LN_05855 [Anaerovoracaceae bacterium]